MSGFCGGGGLTGIAKLIFVVIGNQSIALINKVLSLEIDVSISVLKRLYSEIFVLELITVVPRHPIA